MNKLVISDSCKRSISEIFEQAPNLSCKIYYVANGKLASTRYYSLGKSELIAADEETSQRKNVEKELLSLIEQAKITEQRLRQEIDQLKQNKTSSSTSTFQEPHQATQNLIDSLKSGEGESGVS